MTKYAVVLSTDGYGPGPANRRIISIHEDRDDSARALSRHQRTYHADRLRIVPFADYDDWAEPGYTWRQPA